MNSIKTNTASNKPTSHMQTLIGNTGCCVFFFFRDLTNNLMKYYCPPSTTNTKYRLPLELGGGSLPAWGDHGSYSCYELMALKQNASVSWQERRLRKSRSPVSINSAIICCPTMPSLSVVNLASQPPQWLPVLVLAGRELIFLYSSWYGALFVIYAGNSADSTEF